MIDLRAFVKSLGATVIEEVRPHRIVYAKTMNFRIFLDIEPAVDSLVLSIKQSRTSPQEIARIRTAQDVEIVKKKIAEAFQKIQ